MEDIRFEAVSLGPAWLALVPAVCLTALMASCTFGLRSQEQAQRRKQNLGTRVRVGTLAWACTHALLLAGIAVWYIRGLGTSEVATLLPACLLIALSGVLTCMREELVCLMPSRHRSARLLAGTAAAGLLALECCGNAAPYLLFTRPWFIAVSFCLIAGPVVALWLCGKRNSGKRGGRKQSGGRHGQGSRCGAAPALLLAALCALGSVEHYVLEFRGSAILPSDLFAARTAMAVSAGYSYELSGGMLAGLTALSLGWLFCALMGPASDLASIEAAAKPNEQNPHSAWRLNHPLLSVGAALLATAALAALPYGAVFGADLDYWWSKDWYARQGFLPSFIYAWQDLAVQPPSGYTEQKARDALSRLKRAYASDSATITRREASTAQFAAQPPNILVIQNETYCDLSLLDGLSNGYTGPAFWNNGIADALLRGNLAVSVFGGGTCNTEFEFLTANSLAFTGSGKYPFTMYDLSSTPSLPRQLSTAGYRCVGLHPARATNWNRDRAYAQLGFHEFQSEDDFEGAELYHTHVSDWATYDRALELMCSREEPVFVFDVTMQNHSGYDTGSIPANELRGYTIQGLSESDTFQLNEYLACIDESDRAFEQLLAALDTFEEPTVVVMYGDHHPWFSENINDLLYPHEDPLVHAERIHQTSYVLWANYAVAGWDIPANKTDDSCADMLAVQLLDIVGAPLTDFEQALVAKRAEVHAVNANGWLDARRTWHPLEEVPRDLAYLEYLNFGSTV